MVCNIFEKRLQNVKFFLQKFSKTPLKIFFNQKIPIIKSYISREDYSLKIFLWCEEDFTKLIKKSQSFLRFFLQNFVTCENLWKILHTFKFSYKPSQEIFRSVSPFVFIVLIKVYTPKCGFYDMLWLLIRIYKAHQRPTS